MVTLSSIEQLLEGALPEQEALALLCQGRFNDCRAVYRCLLRLSTGESRRKAVAAFLPHLLSALEDAADPDRVMVSFERFIGQHENPLPALQFLAGAPRAVEILVVLFASSQFLTEILLHNPANFERLANYKSLSRPKSVEQFFTEAQAAAAGFVSPAEKLDALRRFQTWELLRIGACDLLDLYDLPAVTRQLSNLADSLIRACIKIAAAQVGGAVDQLTVIALGKLGGRELNYSSDIDLLFITESDPEVAQHVGEKLIDALARVTPEGFLYRVDMRLRPWGRAGPLLATTAGYINYLRQSARLWERQALLKARVAAGNLAVGRGFLQQVQPLLFDSSFEDLRASVFGMKQRTESQLRLNGDIWGEVKLGEGSIRDVEFTVQFLQLAYGAVLPEILGANTLDALVRLAACELIELDEHRILAEGYIFLRTIEHYLQMMQYRQTHSLPKDATSIGQLARRLGFQGRDPGKQFLEKYEQQGAAIRSIFMRYVGSAEMKAISETNHPKPERLEVNRHMDRMAPSYSETYTPEEIGRHAAMAASLNDDHPVAFDAHPLDEKSWRVTVVAYDFPGELSVITGLLFVYGLNILNGGAFTYEPFTAPAQRSTAQDTRRKIVDVFTVQPVGDRKIEDTLWLRYADDLTRYQHMVREGRRRDVQGDLTKRVAAILEQLEKLPAGTFVKTLYPINIQIDNEVSDLHTVLRIDSPDTFGFLYEFTNALAINGVYIDQVIIDTTGSRVHDTLFVTDLNGNKITLPEKQRELRAASVLIKHFTHLLPFSPNPESALVHFRDFIDQLFRRTNWPDELASVERPEVLQGLARVLGVSDFLWDDFLRMQYANLFPVVTDMDALASAKSHAQLQEELQRALHLVHNGPQEPSENAPWIEAVNAWKDREMFRIDMRHILGHTREFWDFASELSDLAAVVANTSFHLCHEDLRLVYGTPLLEDNRICEMCVEALGKFGGRELGFASDIELMFIYEGNGRTTGPREITTTEFYEKLVEYYVKATRARREGIFEVDLQLRPYGKAGSLAVSLDAFRRYFTSNGPAWAYERQALVKLRPVAGDPRLGKEIARLRDEYVYTGEPFDATAMRAMRERQVRHLVKGGTFNLKYSLGGLVDVEYLVQGLQISHGRDLPELRQTNTREAMAALTRAGILSDEDYTRLRKAHTFLRWFIDSLRVVRGNARDVTAPAVDSEEFAFLARRMRYGDDLPQLQSELQRYTEDVREINARLLG